jgi:atypical dual specificity phosphatase
MMKWLCLPRVFAVDGPFSRSSVSNSPDEKMTQLSNFSYLIKDKVAGSAHPGYGPRLGRNLADLRERGFGAILTLSEDPLEAGMINEFEFSNLHLPIPDFTAPSLNQIERAIEFINEENRRSNRVLIHCFSGFGRTGTILACYLVSRGFGAQEAINEVRRLRPGSIEDISQEEAVFSYERYLKSPSAGDLG